MVSVSNSKDRRQWTHASILAFVASTQRRPLKRRAIYQGTVGHLSRVLPYLTEHVNLWNASDKNLCLPKCLGWICQPRESRPDHLRLHRPIGGLDRFGLARGNWSRRAMIYLLARSYPSLCLICPISWKSFSPRFSAPVVRPSGLGFGEYEVSNRYGTDESFIKTYSMHK